MYNPQSTPDLLRLISISYLYKIKLQKYNKKVIYEIASFIMSRLSSRMKINNKVAYEIAFLLALC